MMKQKNIIVRTHSLLYGRVFVFHVSLLHSRVDDQLIQLENRHNTGHNISRYRANIKQIPPSTATDTL